MKTEIAGIEAYPLHWPAGWKRTTWARTPPYKVSLDTALQDVRAQLRRLGARSCVVSTNVPTRQDGFPRSGLSEPQDKGVAVYWIDRAQRPWVMACDQWSTVRGNLRAIGLALGALRQLERTGASQLLERAYSGFSALPAQASAPGWRSVLNIGLEGERVTRSQVIAAYRAAVLKAHPDQGGSVERFDEINRARDAALDELAETSEDATA